MRGMANVFPQGVMVSLLIALSLMPHSLAAATPEPIHFNAR
jgi:hypothetical protein